MIGWCCALLLAVHSSADVIDEIVEATRDAKVIFLGEPDHGDGGSMTARLELTMRLHRDANVRWVVFESSETGARRAQRMLAEGEDPLAAVRANVLDIWSAAQELEPLFRQMQELNGTETPLRLAGMDCTPVGDEGRMSDLEELGAALEAVKDESLREMAGEQVEALRAWLASYDPMTRMERPAALVEGLTKLALALQESGVSSELVRQVLRWPVWIRSITPEFPMPQELVDERDQFMAASLMALLRSIPDDERVVVWTHNVHMMRIAPEVRRIGSTEILKGMTVPAAAHVVEALGSKAYCLGLGSASGAVQASWNPEPRVIELSEQSFERRALKGTDGASIFVDCRARDRGDLSGEMPGGFVSFMDVEADWTTLFDGVWVLRATSPVRRVVDE